MGPDVLVVKVLGSDVGYLVVFFRLVVVLPSELFGRYGQAYPNYPGETKSFKNATLRVIVRSVLGSLQHCYR